MNVVEEVMRKNIKWEDLDYLEGTRMIVLGQAMQEFYPFLRFTTEVGEGEGWLVSTP